MKAYFTPGSHVNTEPPKTVAAAARWLDAHYPGWQELIDTKILSMLSNSACILAQIFGKNGEQTGHSMFGQDVAKKGMPFGYSQEGANKGKAACTLRKSWMREIRNRRNLAAPAKSTKPAKPVVVSAALPVFDRSELRTGMRIVTKNDGAYVILDKRVITFDGLHQRNVEDYTLELTHRNDPDKNIVAVYAAPVGHPMDKFLDVDLKGRLLWRIPKTERELLIEKTEAEIVILQAKVVALKRV